MKHILDMVSAINNATHIWDVRVFALCGASSYLSTIQCVTTPKKATCPECLKILRQSRDLEDVEVRR